MKIQTLRNVALAAAIIAGAAYAKTSGPALTGDAAIAQKAVHEVRMYSRYSIFDNVNIRVNNGTVELLGEVTEPIKKSDLGRVMSRIPGVTGVDNELAVAKVSPFDNQLRRQVAGAIYRDPTLSRYGMGSLPSIHIVVNNGHVTLEGVVRTEAEKQIAGMRASTALSLGNVTNNLQVEVPSRKRS